MNVASLKINNWDNSQGLCLYSSSSMLIEILNNLINIGHVKIVK